MCCFVVCCVVVVVVVCFFWGGGVKPVNVQRGSEQYESVSIKCFRVYSHRVRL